MDFFEETIIIVSEILDIKSSSLTLESSNSTTDNWDSLAQLQIIMALENRFNVRFKTTEISELTSIKKLVDRIKELSRNSN